MDKIERLCREIEKGSIAPEGHRSDGEGKHFSLELLPDHFGRCEIENEERICSRSLPGDVVHPDRRESEPVGDAYSLIREDCEVSDGTVCICGCTDYDCKALPPETPFTVVNRRTRAVFNRIVEVFDLVLPKETAVALGVI